MNNTARKKRKILFPVLLIIVASLLVTIGFISGFILGEVQVNNQDYQSSFSDIIKKSSQFLSRQKVESDLFNRVWEEITTRYAGGPIDERELFYGALKGMVHGLGDPYSLFLDPEETKLFNQELNGSFEGIGTEIGIKNHQLTIIAPLPDSPAAKAGLKPGDVILKIDDQETRDMSIDMAVRLIRGPKGSTVVLTVVSKDAEQAREVSIVRDIIEVASVSWEMKDNNIAYVKIYNFDSDTDDDFKKVTNEILVANPQGLIVDVRNNPGGYFDTVINIASEFLEDKVVVVEDFGDNKKEYLSQGTARLKNLPVVVLVNGGSASASEILAGALQDHHQAIIVGEQTFGKGSVQDYERFNDGSSLKLTVSQWLTPNGTSINEAGITPDIKIELTEEDYNNDRDPQLDKALELLNS